jgi:hypothetical protein
MITNLEYNGSVVIHLTPENKADEHLLALILERKDRYKTIIDGEFNSSLTIDI